MLATFYITSLPLSGRTLNGGFALRFEAEVRDQITAVSFPWRPWPPGGRAPCPSPGNRARPATTLLFPGTGPDMALDLAGSRADSKGITIQVYRAAGRPQYATG